MKRKISWFVAILLALSVLGVYIFASINSGMAKKENTDAENSAAGSAFPNAGDLVDYSEALSIEHQLTNRNIIEDFSEPSLWRSTDSRKQTPGAFTLTGSTDIAEAYRKFDSFLQLKTYLFLKIGAVHPKNIEWITLYLMEDLSYTNYYECDLLPHLSEGNKTVILNQRDFTVGAGAPEWDQISTIKIAFETSDNAGATITVTEISTYAAYPMCSIWFDDGWKTTYSAAFPIMKEKNMRGILSVIGSQVGCPSYCDESELDALYDYGWDFTNHTYNHANLTELQPEEAEKEVSDGLDYLTKHGYIRTCRNVVPPYCATNGSIDAMLSKYAATSRVQTDTYNYLPITDPYHIGFKEVTSDTSPATVQGWIDQAIENDLWLVLMFHSVALPTDVYTKYDPQNFQQIVDYLARKSSEIKVVTLSELLNTKFIVEDKQPQANTQTTAGTGKPGWNLIWEDNFDHEPLNEKFWNALNSQPASNHELQIYRESNIKITGGCLQIISNTEKGAYYSGAVTTENKQLFQYGKIEIRAKLPVGKGIFPAFWMLPQSGDSFPEVDIIEFLGDEPDQIWHVMHYLNNGKKDNVSKNVKGKNFDRDFHLYTLQWSKENLIWMIDGTETFSVKNNIPGDKMFLYINTAIGGDWPGDPDGSTVFPQTMSIDYVKYSIWND